jgi:hypothetical protein
MLVDKEKESDQLGALGHGVGSVGLGKAPTLRTSLRLEGSSE